MIFFCSI